MEKGLTLPSFHDVSLLELASVRWGLGYPAQEAAINLTSQEVDHSWTVSLPFPSSGAHRKQLEKQLESATLPSLVSWPLHHELGPQGHLVASVCTKDAHCTVSQAHPQPPQRSREQRARGDLKVTIHLVSQ